MNKTLNWNETSREELARLAFCGVLPVLYDACLDHLNSPNGASWAECVAAVKAMSKEEIDMCRVLS